MNTEGEVYRAQLSNAKAGAAGFIPAPDRRARLGQPPRVVAEKEKHRIARRFGVWGGGKVFEFCPKLSTGDAGILG